MSFKTKTCIAIACDGGACDGTHGAAPHFDGFLDAIAWTRSAGWLITDDKLLCPGCLRKADCEATAHQWGEWENREKEGIRYRDRTCGHCDTTEWDPPLDVLGPKFQALRDVEAILRDVSPSGDVQ